MLCVNNPLSGHVIAALIFLIMYLCIYTCTHTHTRTRTHARTHTHTRTRTHACTHTHTHTHTHTCQICMYVYVCICIVLYMYQPLVMFCSYLFHMSFASSFVILHHLTRHLLIGNHRLEYLSNSTFVEFVCVILTSVFAFPLAVMTQFMPLYHVLHDLYGVHTEVIVLILLGVYVVIVWIGDRHREVDTKPAPKSICICVHHCICCMVFKCCNLK